MAARVVFLTLAALLAGCLRGPGGGPACLGCHETHYSAEAPCTGCHRGSGATDRVTVAHAGRIPGSMAGFRLDRHPVLEEGRRLAERLGCRRCHVVGAAGNRFAADLDGVLADADTDDLVRALREPAEQMPDFALSTPQAAAVVTALLRFSWEAGPRGDDTPGVVHFERASPGRPDPFSEHCGGCHRMLTERRGGLGNGAAGPNLSGLFTQHYPLRSGEDPWTPERLTRWVGNPRALRPNALMRPVLLEPGALDTLLGLFAP